MNKLRLLCVIGIIAISPTIVLRKPPEQKPIETVVPGMVEIWEEPVQSVSQISVSESKIVSISSVSETTITQPTIEISYEEAQILMKIAMAEANADGVEGKAMVMKVVLNRVKSDTFPNSIEEVVLQEGQFSPITDGSYKKAEPDTECHIALAEIEMGKYENIEALFFDNCKNSWASRHRELECKVGHHNFYR